MPITLNANKFIASLSNLICYTFYKDNYRVGDEVDKLLDFFRSDDTVNGDGKLVITSDLPVVKDLNFTTSTLLTNVPPVVQEQYIPVTEFKYIQLTINKYLLRGAFADEYAMSNLVSYLVSNMRIAKRLSIYDNIESKVQALITEGVNGVTLQGIADPTTATSAVEINAIRTHNTNLLYRTILTQITELGLGKTLTANSGTGTYRAYETSSNLALIVPPALLASMDVDTLATLLNSSKISSGITVNIIQMNTGADNKCLLIAKDTIQYGFFYQVATAFFDASNLNNQDFLHFSYYSAIIDRSPSIPITLTNFFVE